MTGPITRGTIRTAIVLGLRLLAQAGTLLIAARLLGPAQFGAFAGTAALAVTLGALSTFGTHLLLLREVSRAPDAASRWLPIALATTLICSISLFSAYILISLLWLRPIDMGALSLLAIGISDIIVMPLLVIPAVIRQGREQIVRSQLIIALPQGLRLLAAFAVALWQPDQPLFAYAIAYALAAILCLPVGLGMLDQPLPHWRSWRLPTPALWRKASGYAALNLSAMGPNELDKTLAIHILPATAAGTYAVGSRVLGPLVLPVLAMMIAALPRLFREHMHTTSGSSLVRTTLFLALCYGLLAGSTLWLCAPLLTWVFGAHFGDLTDTLRWLALAAPGIALRHATSNALLTRGHTWVRVGIEGLGVLIMLGTAAGLVSLGIKGMALALTASEWSMCILGLTALHRFSLSRPSRVRCR